MSDPNQKPAPSPLATPEPWDLVRDGYVEELWDQFSEFAKDALELAKVAPGSDVLDVCTGPGTLAMQAALNARRVVGVDFSPRMLEELRRRAEVSGFRNIEAVEADGQALPFEDASFDGAFSMFGLIFFPDRAKGFRELHRVLRPGGRAVVSSWRPFEHVPPIKAAFDFLVELMPELPFGKNKAPLGEPDEFRTELSDAGFTSVDVHIVKHKNTAPSPAALWTSMAKSTAPFLLLRRRIGEERWSALSDGILARMLERFGPGPLDVELQALLGVGTKR
ncbi:MAG TPA: methyltransferase domain-containing protein [Polyangiaceae bacterium]|nr:methyltransferase domain-containing protein [Polyangiaceae bacterium]